MAKHTLSIKISHVDIVEPGKVNDFKPVKIIEKPIKDLTCALEETGLSLKRTSIDQGYLFMQGDDISIRVTDFYDDNEKQRLRKDKSPLIVNHGLRGSIEYDPSKFDKAKIGTIRNILYSFCSF